MFCHNPLIWYSSKPINLTSSSRSIENFSLTVECAFFINLSISSDDASPSFIKKLACLSEIFASPITKPFNPASSISFPAELFFGFLNKLPADLLSSGCVSLLPLWALRKFSLIKLFSASFSLNSADSKISSVSYTHLTLPTKRIV